MGDFHKRSDDAVYVARAKQVLVDQIPIRTD